MTSADDAAGVSQRSPSRRPGGRGHRAHPGRRRTAPPRRAPATTVAPAAPTVATTATAPSRRSRHRPTPRLISRGFGSGQLASSVGLFLLGVAAVPRERVSKARLGIDKPRNVSDIGTRTVSAVDEALEQHGKRADLGNALAMADISMKPAEFVAMVGVVAVVAGLVGLALVGPFVALAVAGSSWLRQVLRPPNEGEAPGGLRRSVARRPPVGHHCAAKRLRNHAGARVGGRGG